MIICNVIQTNQRLRKKAKNIELRINGKLIRKTENLKYLGINFTRNFKFSKHLEYTRKKMIAAYFSLKGIFFNRKIDMKLKLLAYKQIIKPIALYGAPIWHQVSRAQINKIALLERKILRACSGLYRRPGSVKYYKNSHVYKTCKIEPIEKELIVYSLKFINKIRDSETASLRHYIRYNEEEMNGINYYSSKPPNYINYLNDKNELFENGNQKYYEKLPTIREYQLMWANVQN